LTYPGLVPDGARQADERPAEDLPPPYLARLQVLENLPENLSGADKTWVEEALRTFREHYRQAGRVR
jgi:hypothetical protein